MAWWSGIRVGAWYSALPALVAWHSVLPALVVSQAVLPAIVVGKGGFRQDGGTADAVAMSEGDAVV